MQVTRATYIPLLAAAGSDRLDPGAVRDEYTADLTVVYTFGPQFGRRVVTHADLEQLNVSAQILRRSAFEHLEVLSSRAEFHGQPPALMLSFEGLESSLLLANDFWRRLQGVVPGELVVGVPARDVVVVTGSQSQAGLEKARRCVERVFMAGGENPLTQALLVRRGNSWEPYDRPARQGSRSGAQLGPAHQLGQGQPPRQFQEHPSWPEERVLPVQRRAEQPTGARPARQPMTPAASFPPRSVVNTLPPLPGNLGPAGPATPASGMPGPARSGPARSGPGMTGTGVSLPGMSEPMSTNTGTGMPVVPAQLPRQRAAHSRRAQPDAAPYSAVPYSAVPYSAMPYSAAPYSGTPRPAAPQSGGPRSGVPHQASHQAQPAPHQAAMPYSAVPYSSAPYASAPRSAVPYSAMPYSAAPSAAPQGRPAPQSRPASHREPEPRPARSRAQQPGPRYSAEAKPAYRDEPPHDDRYREDRSRGDRGYDDRYRDDLYSTGSHTGPLYPPANPVSSAYPVVTPGNSVSSAYPTVTARSGNFDYQPDVPQPNYPDSWGWVPDGSAPRQHRPLSPRDRFSR